MERIAILGPCGAGKSTLARQLGEILNLPVIHLDRLYWQPGWVSTPDDEFERRLEHSCAGERWIIDGNYSRALAGRIARAETIVVLDFPRWRCMWRVTKRIFRFSGVTRPDMGTNCPERLDWEFLEFVWNFHANNRPRIMRCLDALTDEKKLIVLRRPREVDQLVESIVAARNARLMY